MKATPPNPTCRRYIDPDLPVSHVRANRSPQIMVVNFTGEYARVVQGALVRPCLDADFVELRISVSANLCYLDKTNAIIPDIWKQLLGWTFCRTAKTKHDGNTGKPGRGLEKLVISKIRGQGMDEREDEVALRNASKSTTSSVTRSQEIPRGPDSGRTSPISSSSSSPTSPYRVPRGRLQ